MPAVNICVQMPHPDCGEPSTQDQSVRSCRTLQLIKGVTGFVLTNVGISTTTLLETPHESTKPEKPGPEGKEQSWAVCRAMGEDDQRRIWEAKEGKRKARG